MTPPLFLIGYRATGKTATARCLAELLHRPWIDADVLLEERAGRSIREIFASDGEPTFRDLESKLLIELAERENCIIATGGGVILRPENRAQLQRGRVVWLRAPAPILWERLQADALNVERRPNLAQGGLAEVESLLTAREPWYQASAELTLDSSSHSPQILAEQIKAWLDMMNAS